VPLVIVMLASKQSSSARPERVMEPGMGMPEAFIQANETQMHESTSEGFDLARTVEAAVTDNLERNKIILTENDTSFPGTLTITRCGRENHYWNQEDFKVKWDNQSEWKKTINKKIGSYDLKDWSIYGTPVDTSAKKTGWWFSRRSQEIAGDTGVDPDLVERARRKNATEEDIETLRSRFDPEIGLIFKPNNRKDFHLGCAVTVIDPETKAAGIAMQDFELCVLIDFDKVDMSSVGELIATTALEASFGLVGSVAGKGLGLVAKVVGKTQEAIAWARGKEAPKLLLFDGELRLRIEMPRVRLGLRRTESCESVEGFFDDDDVAAMNVDVLEWKPGARKGDWPFEVINMGDATLKMVSWLSAMQLPNIQNLGKSAWDIKQTEVKGRKDMDVLDYILDQLGVIPLIASKITEAITSQSTEMLGRFIRSILLRIGTHAAGYRRTIKGLSWVSSVGQAACGVDKSAVTEFKDPEKEENQTEHQTQSRFWRRHSVP